jgi:xanthine/CO dehydrogenase XdhC/CoxF family maturation factor
MFSSDRSSADSERSQDSSREIDSETSTDSDQDPLWAQAGQPKGGVRRDLLRPLGKRRRQGTIVHPAFFFFFVLKEDETSRLCRPRATRVPGGKLSRDAISPFSLLGAGFCERWLSV